MTLQASLRARGPRSRIITERAFTLSGQWFMTKSVDWEYNFYFTMIDRV